MAHIPKDIKVNVKANLVPVLGQGTVVFWNNEYWDVYQVEENGKFTNNIEGVESVTLTVRLSRDLEYSWKCCECDFGAMSLDEARKHVQETKHCWERPMSEGATHGG